MRNYILSKHEKKVIQKYLEEDLRLNGFNVLKLRMIKALPQLKKELELIELALEKLEKE